MSAPPVIPGPVEPVPPPVTPEAVDVLADPSVQVVFAFAPAGLGHLRVTDALYQGLARPVSPILLGAEDQTIRILHRIMSVHPLARAAMEWVQGGRPEMAFTLTYRSWLRARTAMLRHQVGTLVAWRLEPPETLLVVATHFGLAHQLAALKKRVRAETGVRLVVVVVVTDDSPQPIWYVPGADLTFVPSALTRERLLAYGRRTHLAPIPVEVAPYPIAPSLTQPLTEAGIRARVAQMDPAGTDPIVVAVPVSGAAVGLPYTTRFVDALHDRLPRTRFEVVSRITPYTGDFLEAMSRRGYVRLHATHDDREVVRAYDAVYRQQVVGLELTKPSEQTFKVLATPDRRGGAILLLTRPVGRQEYDNVDFLRRHGLVPTARGRDEALEALDAGRGRAADAGRGRDAEAPARRWRALALPFGPEAAATEVARAHGSGLLRDMVTCRTLGRPDAPHPEELGDAGVARIWERIAALLRGELGSYT